MSLVVLLLACVPHLTTPGGGAGKEPWSAPENSWPMNTPPEDLEGEGCEAGEVVPEFRLLDQHGDEVSLWQFYGLVTVIDVSTMWCRPCQELAADVEETALDYADDGVVYLTVLPQDLGSDPPDQAELNEWGDFFGITQPILSDDDDWYTCVTPDDSFPSVVVADAGMRSSGLILDPDDAKIRAAIDAAL